MGRSSIKALKNKLFQNKLTLLIQVNLSHGFQILSYPKSAGGGRNDFLDCHTFCNFRQFQFACFLVNLENTLKILN
jgi:hypothetical protein